MISYVLISEKQDAKQCISFAVFFLRVGMLSKCVVYIYIYVHVDISGWRDKNTGETGYF